MAGQHGISPVVLAKQPWHWDACFSFLQEILGIVYFASTDGEILVIKNNSAIPNSENGWVYNKKKLFCLCRKLLENCFAPLSIQVFFLRSISHLGMSPFESSLQFIDFVSSNIFF